ncbi:MAG: hypothetical protein AB7P94_17330 [Steroidobacteraceae bacterium]
MGVKVTNENTGGGGGTGDVVGPASSTKNAVPKFADTSGKVLENTALIMDNNSDLYKTSLDFLLSTVTSGDIGLRPSDDLTLVLGAAKEFNIDATSTPHTGAGGVLDLNVTTSSPGGVSGIDVGFSLSGDVTNARAYAAQINKLTTGLTGTNFVMGYLVTMNGNASDNGGEYRGFQAGNFTRNGGTSTAIAFDVEGDYDYALSSDSGDIRFVDYSVSISALTVSTGDGNNVNITAGSGVGTDQNGGDVIFAGGSPSSGTGTNGVVQVSTRFVQLQGADVASATTIKLTTNCKEITGTTDVAAIDTTKWQNGSRVVLFFSSGITVKHNTAGATGSKPILLTLGVDFVNPSYLELMLCEVGGIQAWRQIGGA